MITGLLYLLDYLIMKGNTEKRKFYFSQWADQKIVS